MTSVEQVKAALTVAEKHAAGKGLNIFIHLTPDDALREAADWDKRQDKGVLGGIPVAVKDLISIKGQRMTCGSKILEHFVAPYDATCVQKLRAAGGISIGKLNMDEFAMGSSNENSAYGPVKNPHAEDRTPGGSSGGSAAVVAAGIVDCALGTDTGGSIRTPAAFCGVVGIKPTYGRVSRYGVTAFASSLDQVGVLAKNVTLAAKTLQAICGHDPRDSTSSTQAVADFVPHQDTLPAAARVGVLAGWDAEPGLSPDVALRVKAAIAQYKKLGAEIVEVSLPRTKYGISAYYLLATAEASSNLARYDGVRYGLSIGKDKGLAGMYETTRSQGFGAEVKRRILLGTYVLSAGYYDAYYVKAQKVRTRIRQDFDEAFKRCDVILTPTTPTTAFRLGEKLSDPLAMYLTDVFTVPVNLAGLPAMSIPCGKDPAGLPVGMQLIGNAFDEANLLRYARAYEAAS